MTVIRTIDDIREFEAMGFDALCPQSSPWEILQASAQRWPDRTAIHYLTDAKDPMQDVKFTYSELQLSVAAAASAFRKLGITRDDSVVILANHTPSAQIALWGAQLAGRACPVNPLLQPEHIVRLLEASGAKVLVVMGPNPEQDYWKTLVPALRKLGVSIPIFDCDSVDQPYDSDGSFETLMAGEQITDTSTEVEGDDLAIAALYHTGGTTGVPKLVKHTRRNEAHVARCCAVFHDYGPEDVVLNGFPLFHVAGAFVYGLSVLSTGGCILIPGRLGMRNKAFLDDFWGQVERTGITVLGAVPTILSGLLAKSINADVHKVRAALTGGSPLPPELADAFEAKTNIPVRNIFGMTESSGSIALEPIHAERIPLSCGFPLPFSEIEIVDQAEYDNGALKPLSIGETGIVMIRGANISPGYTETSRNVGTFSDDGWLISGDLGHLDDNGRLFLSGRAKDVIIRGSHNIDPQSIEDALLSCPDIISAAAVGMPDAYAGELPVAYVTMPDADTFCEAKLLDLLASKIEEPAAMPKRIFLIDEMPLTPVGKIFKPSLRKEAIRTAIIAAASKSAITEDAFYLVVDDHLNASLETSKANQHPLSECLVGMPINYTVKAVDA